MSRNASLVARTVSHLAGGASESAAVKWAEDMALQFESLLTASESNEAALLSAIGMAKHERIANLRNRILSLDEPQTGLKTLKSLEERLKKDIFLSPGSTEPTVADAILAWSAREVVDLVLEPADRVYEYPSSNRWLAACLTHDAFKRAYKEELIHNGVVDCDGPARVVRGEVREGFMIDAKPVSTDARRAADIVKAINAGYKKQQTQRQKEKAAVESTSATSTQAAATNEAAVVLDFLLGETISSTDPAKIEKCIQVVTKATKLESIERVDHPPAMDATNLGEALANKPGIKCKNLFLKCKKPRNETDSGLQLVCCPVDRSVDLKFLQTQLGYKDQLRFAAQDVLSKALDVVQGNVTPFALVNDPDRVVGVVLDEEMMKNPETLLWFHPLDNTASLGIPAGKLFDFIKASGRTPVVLPLTQGAKSDAAPAKSAEKSASSSPAKKSGSRGGEGAPVPAKKTPAPVDTSSSPKKQGVQKQNSSSSLASPPKTIEEALEREEKALALVQERSAAVEAAKDALEKAKASGGDVEAAEKAHKAAVRAKKEADMIYGNAAGFTERLRSGGAAAAASGGEGAKKAGEATGGEPLVFSLTHELAQDRLWARLHKLLGSPPKRLEGVQHEADQKRPTGHSTHNLLVKDSKTKKLYLICLRQVRNVDLKTIGEKIGASGLRLAGVADVETAIALTRGCITPLSLYNNPQATVTPVFDAALLAEPDKKLVLCAGCDDPLNHPEHNCVEVTVNQMLQLISEAGSREHLTIEL